MGAMFQDASAFNQPLGGWRVDKVTDMCLMFCGASAFNQTLGGWSIDNVTTMHQMFYGASAFNQPLGDWRLACGCNTESMFDNKNFRNSRPVKESCCAIS